MNTSRQMDRHDDTPPPDVGPARTRRRNDVALALPSLGAVMVAAVDLAYAKEGGSLVFPISLAALALSGIPMLARRFRRRGGDDSGTGAPVR